MWTAAVTSRAEVALVEPGELASESVRRRRLLRTTGRQGPPRVAVRDGCRNGELDGGSRSDVPPPDRPRSPLTAAEEVDLAQRIEAGVKAEEQMADLAASGESVEFEERRRLDQFRRDGGVPGTSDPGQPAPGRLDRQALLGRSMHILDLVRREPRA